MAKSKRSRRARRQVADKPVQSPAAPIPQAATPVEESPQPVAPAISRSAPAVNRTTSVDFAKDYYYVYAELRHILIVTFIMFGVMLGLSYLV